MGGERQLGPHGGRSALFSRRFPRTLLADESGIALVLALGIVLVLTIAVAGILAATGGSSRQSSLKETQQKAYALAETGVQNAISVLAESYPGTVAFPGDPNLLPPRSTAYDGGSCTAPVRNCVTWSGTLTGPLPPSSPWRWEWRLIATATVPNPTGPTAMPVTRTARAIMPVVIPTTTPAAAQGPLNFLYSGTDMKFDNSVHVKAQIYVRRDLRIESTAVIDGAADKVAVGRDLYLKNPQNQIGLTGGGDPRIDEIHVVGRCSSKATPALHTCGPTTAEWEADKIFPNVADNVIPAGFLAYTPTLTCCSPVGGAIAPAPASGGSNMGFWYQNADLGPLSPCVTKTGTPPVFDTASGNPDNTINWSATPTAAINLTPAASYTCKSEASGTVFGELSWNHTTGRLTVKGTIFIDGSIYIQPPTGVVARYEGAATIIASGTFGMKNSTICATHPGYTGACDFTGTSPWDPNQSALIVIADGSAGGPGSQGQGSDFDPGDGMMLKGSGFQGALIANKAIVVEVSAGTAAMQGPMISVYDEALAGQKNDLIFPPILFAPSGGGGIVSDPPVPELLSPRNYR